MKCVFQAEFRPQTNLKSKNPGKKHFLPGEGL